MTKTGNPKVHNKAGNPDLAELAALGTGENVNHIATG